MWPALAMAVLLFAQAPDYAAEGMKALEEERYEEAAAAFEKVLASDPDDYAALFHIALIDSLRGNPAAAILRYERVLELKPGLYEAQLNLGILLLGSGQAQRAIAPLEGALATKPDEFRPHYYLAESLFEISDYARAESAYQEAAELNPDDASVQVGLARSLLRQRRLDEAANHFRKAATLDPRHRTALLELATAYEDNKRQDEAIALYREFQDDPAVAERLGGLLLEKGETGNAAELLRRAVEGSPTAANRFALAVACIRLKKLDEAAEQLELALSDEPESFDLRMTYGRVLRDQRNFAPAAQEFLRAVTMKPDAQEAWSELAGMLLLTENFPQALAALDRVEELAGESAAVCYLKGMIYDRSRQYMPAQAAYERFLELSDGSSPDEEFKARQRLIVIRKELSR